MTKKIEIGQKAKVMVRLNTTQSVVTEEEEKSIIALMAKKYGIPAKNISIEKNYISSTLEDKGLAGDVVQNPNDPRFMQELMKAYMASNNITDINFEDIIKIDSQINSLIDFDVYDKSKKYTIKWVKWGNFLSYGPDNFFDFTTLKGLVLLNGEPANKSGKSTFAYDLLHFLLFGKTNTNKAKTLGELFNNYLPEETVLNVEGCVNIDGEDYIIKRTLTRPSAGKKTKTVSNKVEYYKVGKDGNEELLSDENEQGATTTATSKIIKEALGNESDFDLIISANAKDLDNLILLTETEKGRLLSKWIGLSIIEDKDAKAREKWNKEISVGRYSDMYNKVQLENDVESLKEANTEIEKENEKYKKTIEDCENKIKSYNEARDMLLSSKLQVDSNLLKVNVTTLQSNLNTCIEQGVNKKRELEYLQQQVAEIPAIQYSEDDYRAKKRTNEDLIRKIAEANANVNSLKTLNERLAKAEYCPTCHRKLDNVDNTATINENKAKIDSLSTTAKQLQGQSDTISKEMAAMEENRALSLRKSQLEIKIATISTFLANLRAECLEKKKTLADIKQNKDAIEKNGEIDAKINVINANIRTEETIKKDTNLAITSNERRLTQNTESIAIKKSYLLKIEEERKTEKNWKLYLQMIGKDGISKMVLKNTLPIINNELNSLLSDVTDFKVEITMNAKNDVDFLLIRDGITTRLSAASGLERTQSALALRVVLGKLSRLSRPPFILLDEVLGTVARENYDDMKKLYDRIAKEFDFILHITHISEIADWHDNIITVQKIDNISSIK